MTRPGRNKAAEAAMQARAVAVQIAADAGRDYFKQSPNEMLVEVCRRAMGLFDNQEHALAFLRGYSEARIQHDEYRRGE